MVLSSVPPSELSMSEEVSPEGSSRARLWPFMVGFASLSPLNGRLVDPLVLASDLPLPPFNSVLCSAVSEITLRALTKPSSFLGRLNSLSPYTSSPMKCKSLCPHQRSKPLIASLG